MRPRPPLSNEKRKKRRGTCRKRRLDVGHTMAALQTRSLVAANEAVAHRARAGSPDPPSLPSAVRGLATSLPGQTPSLPLGAAALDVHRRRAAEAGGRRGESSSLWQGGKGVTECLGENRRSVCACTRLGEHL